MTDDIEFAQMVEYAKPYAKICGDLDGFAEACAKEVHRSGEPAFYLTTRKAPDRPRNFPVSLEMHGYDESRSQSFVVARMDITRPEYRPNPHGFLGNHLVVALLDEVKERLQQRVPEGVAVLTSEDPWRALIRGPGYSELKSHRALENMFAHHAAPSKPKSRL